MSISQSDYKEKKYFVVTKKWFKARLYNQRKCDQDLFDAKIW